MCLVVRSNQRWSDPPPGRRKWEDAANCFDSSVENDDSLVENDDSSVENNDSSVENDDSSVENNDSSVVNNDSSVENDDSSVENDDSSVENGGAPRYLWSCAFKLTDLAMIMGSSGISKYVMRCFL